MRFFFVFSLLSVFAAAYGQQDKIDSIKTVLQDQSGEEKISSLNELSWYYKNFDVDSAITLAKNGLQISQDLSIMKGISQSLNSLASAFEAKGLLDTALHFHHQALAIKIELKDSFNMANSYNNIGIVYDQLGFFDKSLENYFKALNLYEKHSDDPYNVAMVLGNIGIVYKKEKEYAKVLEYYEKALSIYKELDSDFGVYVTKGNMSSIYLLTGAYEEAIEAASNSMEGYKKLGYSRYVPYMQHNLAIAYDSLNQPRKAEELFELALEGHKEFDNPFEQASTLIGLSNNKRETGQYQESVNHALEAVKLSEELDAKEMLASANLELSKSLAKNNDYTEAFTRLLKYTKLNDSIFEESKTKSIFELQTKYETEKKEQQIALQEAQISENEAQLERNRILVITLVIAVLAVLGLWLLNRNRIRKKQQLILQEERLNAREAEINATISSQEKERARYARDLHDGFGQMISILNMNLGSLKSDSKPDERQKVFEESEKVIGEMYDELKGICFDLMPQTLVKNGLQSGLEEFAERINKAGKVFIETNFYGLENRLSEIQEISLYRITQEWINNTLKYSDASKITLQITKDEQEITLLIEDDGSGFDKKLLINSKGNGWKNLNTRSNLIQGHLELETTPGKKGNTLIINAPSILIKEEKPAENTITTV